MNWPWAGKRQPDKALQHLSAALQADLGKRLKSLIVFGSYVRGEFDPKRSNINVLIVADLSYEALGLMSPAIQNWLKTAGIPPVLVAPDDLDDFARDFPIEFLDMQDHHKVVCGEDLLAALQVNKAHLESQLEHDLALVQLRLRQAMVVAGQSEKKRRQALSASVATVNVLLQAASGLGEKSASGLVKMQADAAALRNQKETLSVQDLASRVLEILDQALTQLRKN